MSDWYAKAACRGIDPALFFPDRGQNDVAEAARRVCMGCEALLPCRDWGLRHEALGVWGGLTEHQRRTIRRRDGIPIHAPQAYESRSIGARA